MSALANSHASHTAKPDSGAFSAHAPAPSAHAPAPSSPLPGASLACADMSVFICWGARAIRPLWEVNPHPITHHPLTTTTEQPKINQYPVFPRAAVNIVVVRARPLNMGREYLFVQRSKEPGTNQWALPGGRCVTGWNGTGCLLACFPSLWLRWAPSRGIA